MINTWFFDDILSILKNHRYVVVTDVNGEGEYLLRFLPPEIPVLHVSDDVSELESRYLAETKYSKDKVVFYSKKKAQDLIFIQEYVQTSGLVVLDDFESYIRTKLFLVLGKNCTLERNKLMLAAKLSEGKSLLWWQSISEGIAEPLKIDDWMLPFLCEPTSVREAMDDDIWSVFSDEVYSIIGRTPTNQPAQTLAKEVVDVMLSSLLDNSISGYLLKLYYQWSDSTEKVHYLKSYVNSFKVPSDSNPLSAHFDYPFASLDKGLMKLMSDSFLYHSDLSNIVEFIKKRTGSKKAGVFKPNWLKGLQVLACFSANDLNDVHDYQQLSVIYRNSYSALDTAMRKVYVSWLNDEKILRPLQEYYTQLNKALLAKWFSLASQYTPSQSNLISSVFSGNDKTAVIVCDGLRLEIADSIVNNIKDSNISVSKNTAFAALPSVTENGMSALFGCPEPTNNAQTRFNCLKSLLPDVEIMQLDRLNESVIAKRLVLLYGDIDQAGEKKQLGGLKDIDNYETELGDKIGLLFRLGYGKVILTTDHGFVITGILDESDKQPSPAGSVKKVEERFILSDNPLSDSGYIEREDKFFDSRYQYYAETDKPFVTRGTYGYAHGGFTPQECIIPVYEFSTTSSSYNLGVSIVNKNELQKVTGNYFSIKLKADGCDSDLFTQERRVKIMLFAGNNLMNGNIIYSIKPGEIVNFEFELVGGIDKVVIIDKDTSVQIDSSKISKSLNRDIDDLF